MLLLYTNNTQHNAANKQTNHNPVPMVKKPQRVKNDNAFDNTASSTYSPLPLGPALGGAGDGAGVLDTTLLALSMPIPGLGSPLLDFAFFFSTTLDTSSFPPSHPHIIHQHSTTINQHPATTHTPPPPPPAALPSPSPFFSRPNPHQPQSTPTPTNHPQPRFQSSNNI
jgi:hypothetical protein